MGSYVNEDLNTFALSFNKNVEDFYEDLPYEILSKYIEDLGKEYLSKFSEDERKSQRWEHVGSTSIPGMPGFKHPDGLIIFEEFPPTKKNDRFSARVRISFLAN